MTYKMITRQINGFLLFYRESNVGKLIVVFHFITMIPYLGKNVKSQSPPTLFSIKVDH